MEGLGVLNKSNSASLHRDAGEEELEEVIKDCDNNKSPGLDGLSYEFYKTVWTVIKAEFLQVL